jgi:hypothetical protein
VKSHVANIVRPPSQQLTHHLHATAAVNVGGGGGGIVVVVVVGVVGVVVCCWGCWCCCYTERQAGLNLGRGVSGSDE